MNHEIINKLIAKARLYPGTFNMSRWCWRTKTDQEHPCGTVGCIAGHAILIKGNYEAQEYGSMPFRPIAGNWVEGGMKALGIRGRRQAERLFLMSSWPHRYQFQYQVADSDQRRAKVIINRLRMFVRSNGKT